MGCDCKFHIFFQFIIEKLIESLFLCLCLLSLFVQVQSLIQLLVNIWKFLLQTWKKIHCFPHISWYCSFAYCFWTGNKLLMSATTAKTSQNVSWSVIVSGLHRIIKQIYIDKDNLHGQWAVGALSQVFKNLRTLLSETEQQKSAAYIECWS